MEREPGRLTNKTSLEAETEKFLRRASQNAGKKRKRRMKKELAALPEEEVKRRLTLTAEDFDTLQSIIDSPGRNAIAQLAALKLKAQFTVTQPKQEFGGDIGVQVIVNTMARKKEYEIPAGATASLPGVVDGGEDGVVETDRG
jgi:ElaB/YqjD/DUF883 family membrane-anchored ribosome-binding protein